MKKNFGKMTRGEDHQVTQTAQRVALFKSPNKDDLLFPTIGVCAFCGRRFSVHEFRDKIGLTEFIISGMCQKCQDKTFEEGK